MYYVANHCEDEQFMAEQFSDLVEVQTSGNTTTITLDSDTADVEVGANGQDGLVLVNDGTGSERVRIDADTGSIVIMDSD